GDFLLCGTINGEREPLVKWNLPKVTSVAIMPRDNLAEYAQGDRTPAKFADWFDDDMSYVLANKRDASPAEMQAGLARLKAEGKMEVRAGEFASELRGLAKSGKKVDLAVFHELAWTKNRVDVLEALQNVLKPGGRAYVPLTWWSPRGMEGQGVKDHLPF